MELAREVNFMRRNSLDLERKAKQATDFLKYGETIDNFMDKRAVSAKFEEINR